MTLIACKECGSEMSDTADACPKCGAKLLRRNWAPLIWIGLPLVAVVGFLAIGTSMPQYEKDAKAARSVCEKMYSMGAIPSLSDCNRNYDNAMANGRASEARK